MPTSLADGLAHAARLQAEWRFVAARDALAAVLAAAGSTGERLAVVTGRRMYAEVLHELGAVDEAYAVAEPLVDGCRRRFGATHPATARALLTLATVVHTGGDLATAADLYAQVADGPFGESGPAGRAVRLARAHRALLHRDLADRVGGADLGAARRELGAAYKALRRAYGIADTDVIRLGVELARLGRRAGDPAAARRLLAVARAGCQVQLDPWHPLSTLVERELAAVEPDLPPAVVRRPGTARDPARLARRPAPVRRPVEVGRRLVALVLAAAALVALTAVAVAFAVRGTRPPPAAAPARRAVTPAAPPDRLRVVIRDDRTSLYASWQAPARGPAPVVVAVARSGEPATVVATVPAGTFRYRLAGVDPDRDYCLILAPVYAGEAAADATAVCTRRTRSG